MKQQDAGVDASGAAGRSPWWRASWIGWGLGLLLLVAAYGPALRGGFIWDDDAYVTGNDTLLSAAGLWRIWADPAATPQYYPLVHTSYWIEQHLWGLNPAGYHATNLLLHALNALLLWRVLRRLALPGAWLAAAFFALHPVHVESVAWITERKNVLSAAFYLGALLAWMRFAGLGGNHAERQRDATAPKVERASSPDGDQRAWGGYAAAPKVERASSPDEVQRAWSYYAIALVLFVCALLAKTVTATLPAVMLLLLWWKRGRVKWSDLWPLIPMFVLGAGLGLMTAWLEKHQVGAIGPDWQLSWLERCLIAGRALWFYAGKLVLPEPLVFIYPRWQVDPGAGWQYIFPLAAVLALLALWALRGRIGRGPLVAALCFAGTLFPALGFLDVYPMRYSFVADHFQYLASISLLALAAAALTRLAHSANIPKKPWLCAALIAVPLLALAAQTWRQTRVYRDLETLWLDTIRKNPDCWMAHANLGLEYLKADRLDEAIVHCLKTIEIRPANLQAQTNLGDALFKKGQADEAVAQYKKAIAIDPAHVEARNNLGHALLQMGRVDEAIAQWEKAVEISPGLADARNNLGLALLRKGEMAAAIAQFRKAVEIRPDYAEAWNNLGNGFLLTGKTEEAVVQYRKAIGIRPDYAEAFHNLGNAFIQSGRTDDAIIQYSKALEISPDLPETLNNLGSACLQNGRIDDAINHFKRAVELRPDFTDARFNLASAHARAGKPDQAIVELRKVTELRPDFARGHSSLALALLRSSQVAGAVASFESTLKINPEDINALVTLAWVLAACPDASLRNGPRAVELSRHAMELSKGRNPLALRSLAAAYAESGRMADALETAQLAVDAAATQGDTALADAIKGERQLYWEGKPARDQRLQAAPIPRGEME